MKINTNAKKERLAVSLPKEDFDYIVKRAEAEGVSKSVLMHLMIRKERDSSGREKEEA